MPFSYTRVSEIFPSGRKEMYLSEEISLPAMLPDAVGVEYMISRMDSTESRNPIFSRSVNFWAPAPIVENRKASIKIQPAENVFMLRFMSSKFKRSDPEMQHHFS